jgi:hypothetical protein
LILITAIDMEKSRFQEFLNDPASPASPEASVYRWEEPRPLVLRWETSLTWVINFKGEKRTLTGRVDYSLWYDTTFKDLTSNLAVIEAKGERTLSEAKAQLLCYMGIQLSHSPFAEAKQDSIDDEQP